MPHRARPWSPARAGRRSSPPVLPPKLRKETARSALPRCSARAMRPARPAKRPASPALRRAAAASRPRSAGSPVRPRRSFGGWKRGSPPSRVPLSSRAASWRSPSHRPRWSPQPRLQRNQRVAPKLGNYDTPTREGNHASRKHIGAKLKVVIAGLDPAIHPVRKKRLAKEMDARVKPAPDDLEWLPLPPVGDAHAAPRVSHLLVVHDGIVDLDPEPEDLRRQRAGRGQHRVGGNHAIALRGDERHPRVDEVLLRVEHVERGALADARF